MASDHRGYDLKIKLKTYLEKKGYSVTDLGTDNIDSVDYPDYAFKLGELVVKTKDSIGIAICGSGIGISIACNKVKGIRCAKVDTINDAKMTRLDNDANVVALNGNMPLYKAKDIIDIFLKTNFSNEERHINRIKKISDYETKKKSKEEK